MVLIATVFAVPTLSPLFFCTALHNSLCVGKLGLGCQTEWETETGLMTPILYCGNDILPIHSTYALCLNGTIPRGKGHLVKILLSFHRPFSVQSVKI